MQKADFTLITYDGLPYLDPDDRLLQNCLEKMGYSCRAAVWNDPDYEWDKAGVCVLRSTWDYHLQLDQFLSWLDMVSTFSPIVNSPEIVKWNYHKGYLRELEKAGLPIVPTEYVERGGHFKLSTLLERDWNEVVIKPAVGLATHGIGQFNLKGGAVQAATDHMKDLLRETDVLIQPFLPSVRTSGERALVFIDSEYSHTVTKTAFQPMAEAGGAGEQPSSAKNDELKLAEKAIKVVKKKVKEDALYARVDIVRNAADKPCIMELELIEPSLFFAMKPQASVKLAEALARFKN